VGERVCLRCDWTGETEGAVCTRCGAPLYRLTESTKAREITPPSPQPQSAGDRIPSSPIGAAQHDESVPPATPVVAASRRRAALIIGGFIVVAIWIVASREGFDLAQTPAIPGRTRTGATFIIGPAEPPGLVGLPPKGAVPSTQGESELVADFQLINYGWAFAYADGRLIWSLDGSGGIHEQRLSSAGVDLVRSGAVSLRKFPTQCWVDSCVSPLPAGAWEDAEIKAWVPSRYAICYGGRHGIIEPSRAAGLLPASAPGLLAGKARTFHLEGLADPPIECSELITDQARVLGEILGDAGFGSLGSPFIFIPPHKLANSIGDEVWISFTPILPDGALVPRIPVLPILPNGS
jgi:hypothetical protein